MTTRFSLSGTLGLRPELCCSMCPSYYSDPNDASDHHLARVGPLDGIAMDRLLSGEVTLDLRLGFFRHRIIQQAFETYHTPIVRRRARNYAIAFTAFHTIVAVLRELSFQLLLPQATWRSAKFQWPVSVWLWACTAMLVVLPRIATHPGRAWLTSPRTHDLICFFCVAGYALLIPRLWGESDPFSVRDGLQNPGNEFQDLAAPIEHAFSTCAIVITLAAGGAFFNPAISMAIAGIAYYLYMDRFNAMWAVANPTKLGDYASGAPLRLHDPWLLFVAACLIVSHQMTAVYAQFRLACSVQRVAWRRIDQLGAEKERLDYERRFAAQEVSRHVGEPELTEIRIGHFEVDASPEPLSHLSLRSPPASLPASLPPGPPSSMCSAEEASSTASDIEGLPMLQAPTSSHCPLETTVSSLSQAIMWPGPMAEPGKGAAEAMGMAATTISLKDDVGVGTYAMSTADGSSAEPSMLNSIDTLTTEETAELVDALSAEDMEELSSTKRLLIGILDVSGARLPWGAFSGGGGEDGNDIRGCSSMPPCARGSVASGEMPPTSSSMPPVTNPSTSSSVAALPPASAPRPYNQDADGMLWPGAVAEGWKRHKTKASAWTDPQGRFYASAKQAKQQRSDRSKRQWTSILKVLPGAHC